MVDLDDRVQVQHRNNDLAEWKVVASFADVRCTKENSPPTRKPIAGALHQSSITLEVDLGSRLEIPWHAAFPYGCREWPADLLFIHCGCAAARCSCPDHSLDHYHLLFRLAHHRD